METSPQRPSLRTIINKKRPKSKLLAGNRLWIRGNFFVEGGGQKLWNCRQFSPFPRPRGRKNSPVRPADGRFLISYPENHRSYPQIATFAPPVVRGKTALCAPALAADKRRRARRPLPLRSAAGKGLGGGGVHAGMPRPLVPFFPLREEKARGRRSFLPFCLPDAAAYGIIRVCRTIGSWSARARRAKSSPRFTRS